MEAEVKEWEVSATVSVSDKRPVVDLCGSTS